MRTRRLPYLVKIANRPNWHIRDGSTRISTRTSDRGKADQALLEHILKSSGSGGVRAPSGGGEIRDIGGLIDRWSDQHKRKNPETWKSKWQYVVRTIKRHAAITPLSSINAIWSQEYADARYDEEVGEGSIIQELSTIRSAWREAIRHGLISAPEPMLIMPQAPEGRDVYLTKPEAMRLIEANKLPHLKLFIETALGTGGRPGAVLGLTWSRVHYDRGVIDLRSDGAREDRRGRSRRKAAAVVPVETRLLDMLRDAQQTSVTDRVIEYRGQPIASVKKSFESAVIRAGLNPKKITPHILRHSAATWMAQDGVDLWEIAGFLGHKDIAMVSRVYGHHSPDFMHRAKSALSLSDFRNDQGEPGK